MPVSASYVTPGPTSALAVTDIAPATTAAASAIAGAVVAAAAVFSATAAAAAGTGAGTGVGSNGLDDADTSTDVGSNGFDDADTSTAVGLNGHDDADTSTELERFEQGALVRAHYKVPPSGSKSAAAAAGVLLESGIDTDGDVHIQFNQDTVSVSQYVPASWVLC
jgi:hypothetical protein